MPELLSSSLKERARLASAQLQSVLDAPDTTRALAETTKQRLTRIDDLVAYLDDPAFRVAFLGQIGVGKSSMIAAVTRLMVGGEPNDKKELKANSVLSVGAGGTTVCEVRIRPANVTERGEVGMVIDPLSVEEMQRTIADFAADQWDRRNDTDLVFDDTQDRDPTPREVQRVIRNMTNTRVKYRTVFVGGRKKKTPIDPLDEMIDNHDSRGSFVNHMIERGSLLSRHNTEWWWTDDEDGLVQMKQRFDEVNHGNMPSAMLPQGITLVVTSPLPESRLDLDLEVIDTRGFDGHLDARQDIQNVLRDPKCLVVSSTSFKDAPSEGLRSLLKAIDADASLEPSLQRMLMVLMDHDDAEQVNGADGDRDQGQDIKVQECIHTLESLGFGDLATDEFISAFDAIQDPVDLLQHHIDARLETMRSTAEDALDQEVDDALRFVETLEDQRIELARAHIDRELRLTIETNQPQGVPLRDPVEGLYDAIGECRYASQVQASNRRNGRYHAMDAYAAIRAGAARGVTRWLGKFILAMRARFRALEADSDLEDVADHLRLRHNQFEQGIIDVVNQYAVTVRDEVEYHLEDADEVWRHCESEWGRGPGFKHRVTTHLNTWSRQQGDLTAHENTDVEQMMPVPRLGEASQGVLTALTD